MRKYESSMLRNVALVSHGGAGKTTLAEAMLHVSGAINRRGTVEEGNTVSDHDPEETRRGISINASVIPCEWDDYKINVLDTPGYFDFVGEVLAPLHVVDGAVVVVCAASGCEVGTEKVWAYCDQFEKPRIVFVNKMDRENANFAEVVSQLRDRFGQQVTPISLPIGSAEQFSGYVDLVQMKAYVAEDGGELKETDIPADMTDEVEEARATMVEAIAATDDELTMKFLEDEPLTEEELISGLRAGVKSGELIPLLCGSATKEIGIGHLFEIIKDCLPSPLEGKAPAAVKVSDGSEAELEIDPSGAPVLQVFKTMADPYVGKMSIFRVISGVVKSDSVLHNANQNRDERLGQIFVLRGKEHLPVDEVYAGDIAGVAKLQVTTTGDTLCSRDKAVRLSFVEFPKPKISMAAEPKAKGDEEKIGAGFTRLAEEDPTFTVEKSPVSAELLISGLGDLHLEVMLSRLSRKFGVSAITKEPRVPYKETVRSKVTAEYRHRKQSGGRGQYGHVIIEVEPLPVGSGFEFVDKIFGGAVPKQYIPAVEKGIRETMAEGVLAGYEVVDCRVTLLDGSYHEVDSSEMAFKLAASMAFRKAFMDANPVLLEPIYSIDVIVPEEYMGDVIGDLNKKRGRILGMDPENGLQRIRAQAPLAELFRYAIDLRSMTQGRGDFTMEFDHYEEVPAPITQQVIEAAKQEQDS
ncbi:MAG: elongation factor G [Firmicutes bacterium]|nr:elongation factor G [Bacillota bacterium]